MSPGGLYRIILMDSTVYHKCNKHWLLHHTEKPLIPAQAGSRAGKASLSEARSGAALVVAVNLQCLQKAGYHVVGGDGGRDFNNLLMIKELR